MEAYAGNPRVAFLCMQTVFEGHEANLFERGLAELARHGLSIPFGHQASDPERGGIPPLMESYRTRGTPWTILIGADGKVLFSDFIVEDEAAFQAMIDASLAGDPAGE